ncbi:MAG TPA: polyphenol oxidase family protein [Acidimicrobiales bacterium]|nr:polyphenol oxidase family protein [Acidimicrobiales bacterium]
MPARAGAVLELPVGDLPVAVLVTTRRAGDLRPGSQGAAARRQAVLPGEWSALRQVHGASVRGCADSGSSGDALVGSPADRPAMFAADCALVALVSPQGPVAAVHAGWQGLRAGVIEAAAARLRSLGARELVALRGPVIGPECYEFGPELLDELCGRFGERLRATTSDGRPALDLAAGVAVALERAGAELVGEVDSCTACGREEDGSARWFSHRARRDAGRHALVVTTRR